jgi:hypothetical protein
MKNLDGKTTSVGSLFSQEYFFRVPEYQRPFSWDSENFDDLIDDIVTASKEQEYFLGTIVLHKIDAAGHYDVVDGQQRLTSLLILLACLRDLLDDESFKSDIQNKIMQRKNVVDGIPEKVRLEVRDREIFQSLVLTDGATKGDPNWKDLDESASRYATAVKSFREKLGSLTQTELQNLVKFLSQKCVVIFLATATFDDAFRLFTIVNDRGKQLRRIDVLKSINIAPDVVSKETVRKRLAQTWEDLEKDLGESTFESIFHLLRLVLLKDKPQGDLLKEFTNRIFAKATVAKGEPFIDKVVKYVKLYRKVFEDRDVIDGRSPDHNYYRALIHIMDSEFKASEWRACLLAYVERFNSDDLIEFCLSIEKVYLEQWVQGVRKDERYAAYAKILALIESAKKPSDVIAAMTYKPEVIKAAVERTDIYAAGFCKYFLLRLELVTSEHDNPREFTAKSIEHVLPQVPDPSGSWAREHDLANISEYVNTIGNLVLLSRSKNSAARNFDFSKKKATYLKDRVSDYPRSLEVLAQKRWTRSVIRRRTEDAIAKILRDPRKKH